MRESPPLDAFVSGGYLLVQPFVLPPGRPPEYVPDDLFTSPILTLTPCPAEILPEEWAFSTWIPTPSRAVREFQAGLWGIPPAAIDDLVGWAAARAREGRILHHDAFVDVATAREFAARFLAAEFDVRLVGLGLSRQTASEFLAEVEAHRELRPGGYDWAPNGVRDGVERGVPLEPGGQDLGYEVLNVALGVSRCSWHCCHVEHRVLERLGIRAKPDGLLASLADAERVATWCRDEAVGCGPNLWRAWRVVEYALAGR